MLSTGRAQRGEKWTFGGPRKFKIPVSTGLGQADHTRRGFDFMAVLLPSDRHRVLQNVRDDEESSRLDWQQWCDEHDTCTAGL